MNRQQHNIHFRAIRPEDQRALQRFHRRLSLQTVSQRFHAAKAELSEPLARRFTDLDWETEGAIVATTGTRGRIIGVARYSKVDARTAEVAIVVEDEYQSQGIGRRLMRRIVELARENGVETLIAFVMPGNERMNRLLRDCGPASYGNSYDPSAISVDIRGSARPKEPVAAQAPRPTVLPGEERKP